ncbi:Extracellular protease inhibitor 10 [Phytophthora ramorum]
MKFSLTLALVAVAVTSTAAATDDNCSFGCLDVYQPVCGSDGNTYSNACYLRLAACKSNGDIDQASDGECASMPSPEKSTSSSTSGTVGCPDACLDVYDPVSDENGVEYSNECYMQMAKCKGTGNTANRIDDFAMVNAQRKLAFAPDYQGPPCGDMLCPDNYAPVCGSDGVTYTNECNLGIASCNQPKQNITQVSTDACPPSTPLTA